MLTEAQNSQNKRRSDEISLIQQDLQVQEPPQDPMPGVERSAVDAQFARQIPSRKSRLIEALKEQSLKYQSLPLPARIVLGLAFLGFLGGFIALAGSTAVSSAQFIAGGIVFFLSGFAICGSEYYSNKIRKKRDQIKSQSDNPAIFQTDIVRQAGSGDRQLVGEVGNSAVEARLLRIEPDTSMSFPERRSSSDSLEQHRLSRSSSQSLTP